MTMTPSTACEFVVRGDDVWVVCGAGAEGAGPGVGRDLR